MKVYDDGMTQLWHADSRELPIPDESVDLIVTSPPYYSARKYGGGASMVWDAAEGCEHVWGEGLIVRHRGQAHGATAQVGNTLADVQEPVQSKGQFCQLCGAWRGQLGLEPTLELYIAHLMQIFDECWRVLKGGVMVVNMGDSYAGAPGSQASNNGVTSAKQASNRGAYRAGGSPGLKPLDLCMVPSRVALALQERGWYLRSAIPWVKRASMPSSEKGDRWERCRVKVLSRRSRPAEKDMLVGAGSKGNNTTFKTGSTEWANCPGCPKCLPNEGLVLRHGNWRPGKSLEWLFILSKTGSYYSDSEGVRMATGDTTPVGRENAAGIMSQRHLERQAVGRLGGGASYGKAYSNPAGRNRREMDWFYESLDDLISHHEREARRLTQLREQGGLVWEDGEPLAMLLNPKGYKEAHFATYPPSLCVPFIKAYTSDRGNCAECGKPWVRVVERSKPPPEELYTKTTRGDDGLSRVGQRRDGVFRGSGQSVENWRKQHPASTLGWRPTCTCEAERLLAERPWLFPRTKQPRKAKAQNHSTWLIWTERVYNHIYRWFVGQLRSEPATVLDPFAGACSTAIAAGSLGRKSIMIECCEEYLDMAIKRLGGGFTVETKEGVGVEQTQMFGEITDT